MPVLSGIKIVDPVSYTATMGSESVTVTFDRSVMTGRWERDINRAMREDDTDTVADKILGVFIAWDVTDDNGTPIPMTTEILLDLPSRALIKLFEGMRKAALPSSEEKNDLSVPTSTPLLDSTVPVSTPPNGVVTSPSPSPSTSPSPT